MGIALGIALGVAIGVALGVALGNISLGIALGLVFGIIFDASTKKQQGTGEPRNVDQIAEKEKHIETLKTLFRSRGELANDDVQAELGVSDATARRYLEELQSEGFIEQIGETGRNVLYRVKQ